MNFKIWERERSQS